MASIVILSRQSFVAKAQCPVGFLAYGVDETVHQLCDGAVVVNISAGLPPFVFIRETLGASELERDTVNALTHTWPNMCQGTYLVFVDDTLGGNCCPWPPCSGGAANVDTATARGPGGPR
jgi:hypothetical protein